MIRRFTPSFVAGIAFVGLASCALPEEPELRKDVQQVCDTLPKEYAYFADKAAYWDEACAQRMAELELTATGAEVLASLETLVDDLYDPHISFNTNSATSPRLVPSGADMWFEREGDAYVLTGIRPGSGAAMSELAIGDRLVRYNGVTPDELILTRVSAGLGYLPEARQRWALNAALAGHRGAPREIEVERRGDVLAYVLAEPEPAGEDASLRYRILSGNVGYIRLHDSLGDSATVGAFEGTMAALVDTSAIILDLRDTPGGGDTDVAEPILGHFIQDRQAYQMVLPLRKKAYLRQVDPVSTNNYDRPLLVLVGHWTGSMGEGIAIGLDGMNRATIMGDRMAGLAGGIEELQLAETGLVLRYPAYGLGHVDGTPRQDWEPSPLQRADFGDGDDLLMQAARNALVQP